MSENTARRGDPILGIPPEQTERDRAIMEERNEVFNLIKGIWNYKIPFLVSLCRVTRANPHDPWGEAATLLSLYTIESWQLDALIAQLADDGLVKLSRDGVSITTEGIRAVWNDMKI